MQKRKTQHCNAGLQGEFYFLSPLSSLGSSTMQAVICGYRVDKQSNVSPIWRRNND